MNYDIECIYLVYYFDLNKFLIKLGCHEDVVEDIIQNAFIQAMKSIDSFKGTSSFKTWLFSIAKYEYYNYLKKNKLTVDIDSLHNNSIGIDSDTLDKLIAEEILYYIASLDPPICHILKLRLSSGISFKEIGRVVGRTENYCRVTFYRVKERLRKEYSNE
ncbi:MAG: sigma-70 family RNA polymerase sigma factor [Clostridiaceae bacterium]|nr:sigma-70 family RNA polymerase sigma factor [Clostridiaceae bacterium]